MNKVEELRARLLGRDPTYDIDDEGNLKNGGLVPHCIGIIPAEVDSLISAVDDEAFARGKAEGAEQERERIRGESQMVGVDEDCIKFIGSVDNYVGAAFLIPVDAMDPPASVLAPTKAQP